MSLTSYQAAPPRVFKERHNALIDMGPQPFLEKKVSKTQRLDRRVPRSRRNKSEEAEFEPAIRQLLDWRTLIRRFRTSNRRDHTSVKDCWTDPFLRFPAELRKN